jgi:hypothetical protein
VTGYMYQLVVKLLTFEQLFVYRTNGSRPIVIDILMYQID